MLNGKVAIVTGAGRGLGRSHALALARAGAAVVVNDVGFAFTGDGQSDASPAQTVVQEIIAAGGQAIANGLDISDWDAAGSLVDDAVKAFGRLDIVVNNAGITRGGPIDKISRLDWERTIAVNLTGTGAMCHWAAAHWRAQGSESGRRIINTTSGMGLTPMPGDAHYSVTKAGIATLTICCAMELADLGVRVNAVAPIARSRISETVAAALMKPPESGFDRMSPDNTAMVVSYLASPVCRFTGRIFGVLGDQVTLFDGWTVNDAVENGAEAWSLDGLAKALESLPTQQSGATQNVMGATPIAPHPFPNPAVFNALAAVEA